MLAHAVKPPSESPASSRSARPLGPAEVATLKIQMREKSLTLRADLEASFASPELAGAMLRRVFLESFPLDRNAVVAGYWPSKHELDVRPLLQSLLQRGHKVVLPVIVNKAQPLRFRQWNTALHMAPGRAGIPVPPENMPELRPDVVLTPLVAFDRQGYRLGRGGGMYDRTLELLRGRGGKVIVVGIGYSGQEVAAVPHHVFDQRLDWVVTENMAFRVGNDVTPQTPFKDLSQR